MKDKKLSKHNLSNLRFQNERRKFLTPFLLVPLSLPVFQIFNWRKNKEGYYLYFLVDNELCKYMKDSAFDILRDKMLKRKKLLSYRCIPLNGRISFLFIFKDKKSRLEWSEKALKTAVVANKFSLNDSKFHQKEGFVTFRSSLQEQL